MAVKNEPANVKFTSEQDRQLKVWRERILGLTDEVNSIEQEKNILNAEVESLKSHKVYLLEQEKELEQKVKTLEMTVKELTTERDLAAQHIRTHEVNRSNIQGEISASRKELDDRSRALEQREKEIDKLHKNLQENVALVDKEKAAVLNAQRKLQDVISTLWK